ncbi:endonuclease/exonuclease/phosphatase family protein [Halomonas sp. PAMB 3232]|uniref:endonuclease/exonuclease/phosphatase family protein n=1 Tax=Halomonas sp. PAMB 3232 TaxID=3075221 RepID=UPI00289CE8A4|nr:endonuclease/exonuclease/phosphatase family protein [Halomonas sp. PAMB 3232]WNL38692.1 endonuclease/exonuclease/phosphatase family protein [Halomonas sp. PAMB 3232]
MLLNILLWVVRGLTLALITVSLLPEIPSGHWAIRLWEFPRLQLSLVIAVTLLLLTLHAWLARARKEHAVLLVALLATGAWQGSHILPFTPVWPDEVAEASAQTLSNQSTFKIMTANLDFQNDRYEEALEVIKREDPDIALLIEVDSGWEDSLAPLDELYEYREGDVRGEGLGIVVWSRIPLQNARVEHLVSERRASIFATLDVPGIGPVRYAGIHPVPPGLKERTPNDGGETERRNSRERDAELMLVAERVAEDADNRWIVTGDFNDAAWSNTTRLFKELSELKDPRRGRGLLSTYHTEYPLWRYPIDHMFVSDGFELVELDRVTIEGSDHFAITTTLTAAAKDQAPPDAPQEAQQDADELIEEGAKDASEQGVSS